MPGVSALYPVRMDATALIFVKAISQYYLL